MFDLDDTLYLERDFVFSGYRAAAARLAQERGVNPEWSFAVMVDLFTNGDRGRVINHTLDRLGFGADEAMALLLINAYRDHVPHIFLAPDAATCLNELNTRVGTGIVTDGHHPVQRRKLAALGVRDFVGTIVCSDDYGRQHWKPSTLPFQKALSALEVLPEDAVYVGDNPHKDFIGARSLGMATVRIRRPGGLHERTALGQEFEADVQIESLVELLEGLTGASGPESSQLTVGNMKRKAV